MSRPPLCSYDLWRAHRRRRWWGLPRAEQWTCQVCHPGPHHRNPLPVVIWLLPRLI